MPETPTAAPSADSSAASSSLTARTVRGAAWTLSTSLGTRVIGLVGTLLLARYLAPEEYGEVTAASIVPLTAFAATSLGVGNYLLVNPKLGRAEVFHATCWFLSTGVVALAVAWAASGVIGPYFHLHDLPRYMPIFVVSTLLDRYPVALLTREV